MNLPTEENCQRKPEFPLVGDKFVDLWGNAQPRKSGTQWPRGYSSEYGCWTTDALHVILPPLSRMSNSKDSFLFLFLFCSSVTTEPALLFLCYIKIYKSNYWLWQVHFLSSKQQMVLQTTKAKQSILSVLRKPFSSLDILNILSAFSTNLLTFSGRCIREGPLVSL